MAVPSTPESSTTVGRPHRDPALDGMRGVAVLLVFLFHYGGGLRSHNPFVHLAGLVTEAGWLGVVLFFALSGFLITQTVWRSRLQPGMFADFYRRRALRVLPLYYSALLLVAVASVGRGTTFAELSSLGYYVFFLQDLPFLAARSVAYPFPLPVYHLWSIAVEEQFYLLWPALLLLPAYHGMAKRTAGLRTRRSALRLTLWVFAGAALFRILVYTLPAFALIRSQHAADNFLLTHASALVLGAAVALILATDDPTEQGLMMTPGVTPFADRWAVPAFWLGVAVFLGTSLAAGSLYLTAPIQFTLGLPAISVSAAALIPLLLRPGRTRTCFAFAPLAWLGRISYSFYVLHILLQPVYDEIGARVAHADAGNAYQLVRLLVGLPITVVAAWASFHLIEMPFLQRARRYRQPTTAT